MQSNITVLFHHHGYVTNHYSLKGTLSLPEDDATAHKTLAKVKLSTICSLRNQQRNFMWPLVTSWLHSGSTEVAWTVNRGWTV